MAKLDDLKDPFQPKGFYKSKYPKTLTNPQWKILCKNEVEESG